MRTLAGTVDAFKGDESSPAIGQNCSPWESSAYSALIAVDRLIMFFERL